MIHDRDAESKASKKEAVNVNLQFDGILVLSGETPFSEQILKLAESIKKLKEEEKEEKRLCSQHR